MRYVHIKSNPQQRIETHPSVHRNRLRKRAITVGMLVITTLVIGVLLSMLNLGAHAKKVATPQPLDQSVVRSMGATIQESVDNGKPIMTSVSIIDLVSGGSYHYGSHDAYTAASINKLVTATLLLHQIDDKKISLYTSIDGQKVSPLLMKMIEDSNNDAWTSINHFLTPEALSAWAKENHWNTYNYSTNTISSDDAAHLLAALYKRELLTENSTAILLGHMKKANETNLIVQQVPGSDTVYHKAGWLDDDLHDAAIIDNGTRPFALVIFTEGDNIYTSGESSILFKKITEAALAAFRTQRGHYAN